jgi:hypothetical protein
MFAFALPLSLSRMVYTLWRVRYETQLSRDPYNKALHELEALQVRRADGAAPLARLDVDGLTGG